MSEPLVIRSHRGPYSVRFDAPVLRDPSALLEGTPHVLVDANVARRHAAALAPVLARPDVIVVEATEENKSLQRVIPVIERLVAARTRRDHVLVAIGGGIVQDVTCFIASTLLRGVPWRFAPTTLLAQADSCIGSKSSINLGDAKNILGTFNPPREILIDAGFLDTLDEKDVRSGIGEILKVHAIDGPASFDRLAADFDRLTTDRATLLRWVRSALEVKKRYIEEDEFDQGVRNVFNYGHSFGHAIESATRFAVPHGIAVGMGMDVANSIAVQRGLLPAAHRDRMRAVLRKNHGAFARTAVPLDAMLGALMKDKKNTTTMLGLVLPLGEKAEVSRVKVAPDDAFRAQCAAAFAELAA